MDRRDIYHLPAANAGSCNRTLCSVLEEMRTCYETRNFAQLPGLIEEAQTYGNRMEAKLYDVKDYQRMKERYRELKAETEKLKTQSGGDTSGSDFCFD
jgi:hypothetical protein